MTAARTPCPVPMNGHDVGTPAAQSAMTLPVEQNNSPFDANSPIHPGRSCLSFGQQASASVSDVRREAEGLCAHRGNEDKIMETAIRPRGDYDTATLLMAWFSGISARFSRFRWKRSAQLACIAWVAALLAALAITPAQAQPQNPELKLGEKIGSVSGLPLPRFVSLKADRVNLREGPSREHRTTWVFQRAGLPVEITAEFDVWRKVRDSEGTEGWVLHSLLSGRRTALVAPWKKGDVFTLYATPSKHATPVAKLQSGVIASIKSCDGHWCHVSGEGFEGYIRQTSLWGVYPNEKIN